MVLALSASAAHPATYTVTNTNNSGAGSLRDAINQANGGPASADTITFSIGSGPQTIAVGSGGLPDIVDTLLVDATTQPGYSGTPLIRLDGPAATGATAGINIRGSGCTVRGFLVTRFPDEGLEIDGSTGEGDNNVFELNWVGIDAAGAAAGNLDNGILISESATGNIVRNNVVCASTNDGILIRNTNTDNNWVYGNIVGLGPDGTTVRANGRYGVQISGTATNNIIGTNADATNDAAERNIISGNVNTGIVIAHGGNFIRGNYIGTDVTGTLDRGNQQYGIDVLDVPNTVIGGTTPESRNVISGNGQKGISLWNTGTTGSLIAGNYIGLNAAGTAAVGNSDDGIGIGGGASGNTIGGTTAAHRNVISGNLDDGIEIAGLGTDDNDLFGNYFGTDYTGTVDLGNARHGVVLYDGVQGTRIGGSDPGQSNVISGNGDDGVVIDGNGKATSGNVIAGNRIGTDVTGLAAIPNDDKGVSIFGSAVGNVVGGTAAATAANRIAHNGGDGVAVTGNATDNHLISGNEIFGNGGLGIDIGDDGPGPGTGDANDAKAAPVIDSLTAAGADFTVAVTTSAAGDTLEFFRVNNGSPAVGSDPTGAGEAYLFLGRCVDNGGAASGPHLSAVADADPLAGHVQVTVLASGFAGSDTLTATAIDHAGNTSEFAANAWLADADLSVAKSVDDTAPNVGSNAVFTIIVSNAGPANATGVAVTDTLAAGYTYVGDDGGGSYVSATGVWTVGALAAGAADTLNVTARVQGTGPYGNTAEVTASDQPDPDSTPGNGVPAEDDQDAVTPTPQVLAIVKRAYLPGGPAVAHTQVVPSGSDLDFLLYVNNTGGATEDVTIHDVLDPGFTYLSGTLRWDDSLAACPSGCGGAEEDSIYAAVSAGTAGSDAIDGDTVGFSGGSVSAGDGVAANAQLDLAAGRVWALVFTVRVD